MATKRRPLHNHATKLNFRPPTNDATYEPRGTKPTSEPTSIKEIFILMILYVCKKILFFDTNLKVALYLGMLFLVSLIADVLPFPKMYLSRSDNIFNKYFVKFAWAWNLSLLIPYVTLTSFVYCCGQKQRIIKHHLLRIVIATFFWYTLTSLFNVVEASFGRCGKREFPTKATCLKDGNIWNGFDISGHSFILIYGSLFLIEEARSIVNWDSVKEHLRLENHRRASKDQSLNSNPLRNLSEEQCRELQTNYERLTPYIRALVVLITILQVTWDVMLFSTLLYYHIMIEKFIGGAIAILLWFFTYRFWFANPSLLPKLPGDGVFKYMKKDVRDVPPVSARRRAGSIVNGQGPTFMGRPIYPQGQSPQQQPQQQPQQEDDS